MYPFAFVVLISATCAARGGWEGMFELQKDNCEGNDLGKVRKLPFHLLRQRGLENMNKAALFMFSIFVLPEI